MNCPKCKARSSVIRTERGQHGERTRTRQCDAPRCGCRFVTVEQLRLSPIVEPIDTDTRTHALARDAGYDREAIAAAIRTDRRRAAIARRQAIERAAELDDGDYDAPADAMRELRGY